MYQRHQSQQEIRGSVAEGSACAPRASQILELKCRVLTQALGPCAFGDWNFLADFAVAGAKAMTTLAEGRHD